MADRCDGKTVREKRKKKKLTKNKLQLVVMASMGVAFLLVFSYSAMFGLLLAFTDGDYKLKITDSLFHSDFVGFDNFLVFFRDDEFVQVLANTLGLNLLMLLINFPAPILFALLINEIRHRKFKRVIQTITCFPHFISWMIYGSIVLFLINLNEGIVNKLLIPFGLGEKNLAGADCFWAVMIVSSLLKGVGWGSIIYLTAISNIDASLYEASTIDGANRFQKARFITLPAILPTVTIYFLLTVSNLLGNNFEQFYSMQNTINLSKSEVIATFTYKKGLLMRRYSYSTAVGFFESVVGVILISAGNFISRRLIGKGLF